jgi:hypothetical protein
MFVGRQLQWPLNCIVSGLNRTLKSLYTYCTALHYSGVSRTHLYIQVRRLSSIFSVRMQLEPFLLPQYVYLLISKFLQVLPSNYIWTSFYRINLEIWKSHRPDYGGSTYH